MIPLILRSDRYDPDLKYNEKMGYTLPIELIP